MKILVAEDGSKFAQPAVTNSEREFKPARKVLDAAGIRHDMGERTGYIAKKIRDCAKKGKSESDRVALHSKGQEVTADTLIDSTAQHLLAVAQQPVVLVK